MIAAIAVIAVASIATVLTACGSTIGSGTSAGPTEGTVSLANRRMVEDDGPARRGGKVIYGLNAETNGWNPANNQWGPSGLQVAHTFFDTLTAYNDAGEVEPFLAKSYTHNGDYTSWTFELRPEVRFSNGKPANAAAVVRNQQFLRRSPVTGPAYRYGKVEDVVSVGEWTFRVDLSQPATMFPITFATQLGVVADPDWLESNDSLNPVGTGPFTLTDWQIDKAVQVRRNPDYWRKDAQGIQLPYLDEIEFRVIPDDATRANALRAGDVDMMQTTSGESLRTFQELDGFQVFTDPRSETRESMVMLNTRVAPFDDIDARRALALATDKRAIIDQVAGGFEAEANGPIAPTSPWFAETDYPQHDPEAARTLVEQVKARHGGRFAFSMAGGIDGQNATLLQLLQQQWTEVGIEVEIEQIETAALIIQVVLGDYQAVTWAQFDSPNPLADGVWWDGDLAVDPPEFTLNFARNRDDALTAALDRAGMSPDPAVQKDAVREVQERLAADVPYVWISHQRVSLVASDRMVNVVRYSLPSGATGLDLHQGSHLLSQVWLTA